MRIRKLGVVGAGVMGRGIAGLAASAGVPVVLLDIPGGDDGVEPARKGLEQALKGRPPAFLDPDRARLVEIGNTEEHLARLAGCDWVVEAIPEKAELKRALYESLERVLESSTILTTNTSAIPMSTLTAGRDEAFRRRFLGTHFFNPPRIMHLLEVIPTPDTEPEVVRAIERFADRILGKGVVRTRDAPGFIANRLGIYGFVQTLRLMEEHGLAIDAVDTLTGPLMGRPRSATYRTMDLAGLDVAVHTAEGMIAATGEDLAVPDWLRAMVEAGRLGDKAGAGFYRRTGKEVETLDWETGEYRPRRWPEIPGVTDRVNRPLPERLAAVLGAPDEFGRFARALYARTSHYALTHAAEMAFDLPSIDRAMEWGYAWEAGPIAQLDLIGLDRVRELYAEQGLPEPDLLRRAGDRFYRRADGARQVLAFAGGYEEVPDSPDTVSAAVLRERDRVLREDEHAALLDMGDGVALLEFRTKMGTLGQGLVGNLIGAREWVERHDYAGLVIGHDHPRAFSAGANLVEVLEAAKQRRWDDIDAFIARFQDAVVALRDAPFPVVAAPFGLTLAGGAEVVLHADRVQANAELAMGLVEAGVGLIPAGGGTKELLFRFTEELEVFDQADLFRGVRRAFELIGTARTSESAPGARKLGFLRDGDRITMNRDRLLADARARVLDLAPDYVAPAPRTITALGTRALGNLRYGIWSMREAGQITDHEVAIGHEIAYVLCGGDGAPREVTEADILELERESFLKLLGTEKTQERIAYTLKTGRPLRN